MAGLCGLAAMGVQSASVRLLAHSAPSTNVMTTNTTQFAIYAMQLLLGRSRIAEAGEFYRRLEFGKAKQGLVETARVMIGSSRVSSSVPWRFDYSGSSALRPWSVLYFALSRYLAPAITYGHGASISTTIGAGVMKRSGCSITSRTITLRSRPRSLNGGPRSRALPAPRRREPDLRIRQWRRRAVPNGVLGAPLGAGAAHVVELRSVRIDQASQHPAEVGKIRSKARSLWTGARVRVLIGPSHSGSHLASTIAHRSRVLLLGRALFAPI